MTFLQVLAILIIGSLIATWLDKPRVDRNRKTIQEASTIELEKKLTEIFLSFELRDMINDELHERKMSKNQRSKP